MPNHWVGQSREGLLGTLRPRSEHRCTSVLLPNIWTVLALSLFYLGFLARYRPNLRDRGTVKGTQTGIFGTILYILIQILEKMTYLPVSAVIPPPGG